VTTRRVPTRLLIPAILALGFLLIPLIALVVRAPWRHLGTQLRGTDVLTALRLSIECASIATAISLLVGVPLAWVLARVEFPGRSVVRALVTLPLVLPPVVGGVALLLGFGRTGFIGHALSDAGISLPFSTAGVVVAETFVAMPFLVVAVEGALLASDTRYDEAAATLGATPWFTFWRVTMPLVLPGVLAGSALCWARALGEFGATITFAGNLPGTTQTMPLAVYLTLQNDPDAAIVLSLLMLAVSVAVLVGLRGRWIRP